MTAIRLTYNATPKYRPTFVLGPKIVERFWSLVDKSAGEDGCWLWKASKRGNGYGRFRLTRHILVGANRAAFAIHYGRDPAGMSVCHRCDNPLCVNPTHLFLGDHGENMADMKAKGRSGRRNSRGEMNSTAKLTAADVEQIRARIAAGEGNCSIARDYPVSHATISRIRLGKAWAL